MLNLIEAPIEDKSVIAFVSEPVEYNLSALYTDTTKRDMIPSEVDLKCLVLELMECINFLHANAKTIHMNLAPEHVYVTKDGKLKVAGLNFIQPFSTAEPINVHLDFMTRIGEFATVPNLRFSGPEVSNTQLISAQSDIFSIGCLIYFLCALNRGENHKAFILNQADTTNQQLHKNECGSLNRRLDQVLSGYDSNLQFIIK